MRLEVERSLLIKSIKMIDDLSFIKKVRTYVEAEIDMEQYNRDIDEAIKRMDAGHFVTHDDALKRLSKWRQKGR
jgi:predicted transcriptional regulator